MNKETRTIAFFVLVFGILHSFSLWSYFSPALAPIFYLFLLGASAIFVLRVPHLSAIPVVLNLLLDSSGHLFEWHDISLRLALLVLALFGWFYSAVKERRLKSQLDNPYSYALVFISIAVLFASYNGIMQGHAVRSVIADAIPFTYLTLFYPLRNLFSTKLNRHSYEILAASYIGAALLSLLILYLFSSGTVELQEPLYKWFRDIVAGKVTGTGNGFFRVVTPLHLLLAALLPYFTLLTWKKNTNTSRLIWILAVAVVSINFSRMYFLAIIPATLIFALYKKIGFKKAILLLLAIGLTSLFIYTGSNLAASSGKSFGFEFLTGQANGIVDPESEASASARAAILPHLFQKIKNHPLLGEGIGSTVTYYNPFSERELTTRHLDWGYLEILVEFGILFGAVLIAMLLLVIWKARLSPLATSSLIFLLGVAITTPALFHVYGVSLIAGLAAKDRAWRQ